MSRDARHCITIYVNPDLGKRLDEFKKRLEAKVGFQVRWTEIAQKALEDMMRKEGK